MRLGELVHEVVLLYAGATAIGAGLELVGAGKSGRFRPRLDSGHGGRPARPSRLNPPSRPCSFFGEGIDAVNGLRELRKELNDRAVGLPENHDARRAGQTLLDSLAAIELRFVNPSGGPQFEHPVSLLNKTNFVSVSENAAPREVDRRLFAKVSEELGWELAQLRTVVTEHVSRVNGALRSERQREVQIPRALRSTR